MNIEEFYNLMGYDEEVYFKYFDDFNKLFIKYSYLSKLVIKEIDSDKYKYFCDFKSFFLFYDTFLLSKKCNVSRLIYLLTDSFDEATFLDRGNNEYIILDDANKYKDATREALHFIRDYVKLDSRIKDELKYDTRKKIINSYNAYISDNKVLYDDSFLKLKFGNKFMNKYKYIIGK